MRFARPLALAVALSAAAALPAAGAAASAPASAHAKATTVTQKAAKQKAAKQKVVKQISFRNGQYVSLHKRVRSCPTAQADLRSAATLRRAGLHRVGVRLPMTTLKTKRTKMNRAVLTLSKAAKRCATAPAPQAVVTVVSPANPSPGASYVPAPPASSVPLPVGEPTPAPIVNVIVPGAGQVVIPSPTLNVTIPTPGDVGGVVPIGLDQVLSGGGLDLGQLTDGDPVGGVLQVVGLDQLSEGVCAAGTVCVVIDPEALKVAVSVTLGQAAALPGDPGQVVSDPTALLGQIQSLIDQGEIGSLLQATQGADGVVHLVPVGPLAELAGSPSLPSLPVGGLLL